MINRYSIFSVLAIVSIYILVVLFYIKGYKICVDSMLSGFDDLRFVLRFANCLKLGFNPYRDVNVNCVCYEVYNYPFNYPRFSLFFVNFIHLTVKNIYYYVFFFISLFLIFNLKFFSPFSFKRMVIFVMLLVSPPILLLLERANLDLIIFLLIALAFYPFKFLKKRKTWHFVIRYLIIFLVGLMKLYPIVLLLMIFTEKLNNKIKLLIFIALGFLFVLVNLYYLDDYLILRQHIHQPSELAFGKYAFIQEIFPENYLLFALIIIVSISFLFIYFLARKKKFNFEIMFSESNLSNYYGQMFLIGSLIYIFSFILSNNYDYKLVFLLLTIPYILNNYTVDKKTGILYFIFIFILFYATSLHRYIIPFKSYFQWFVGRNFLMTIKYLSSVFLVVIYVYIIIMWIRFKYFIRNSNYGR